MKILLLSDLHFEFYKSREQYNNLFLSKYKNVDYDVCVVAGDLTNFIGLKNALEDISNTFKIVLYTLGNHDCWGTKIQFAKAVANDAAAKYNNFHFLDNSEVVIDDQRFLGGTLWFNDDPPDYRYMQWSDYNQIINGRVNINQENRKTKAYLYDNVREGDVVITHHLPSDICVHPMYKGDTLNRFFVCDVSNLILNKEPKLWAHGHSHMSMDEMLGKTRIIRNPYGYHNYEINPEFKFDWIVEI